jgi:hypothetical protein
MVPLSSVPVPVFPLWCSTPHFLCNERRVVGIVVTVRKGEDGNVNFTMTREYFSLQAIYIAIPKCLPKPPCSVMYSRVWFFCRQMALQENCCTNRKLFEMLTKDFSARSGWSSTWHRTERLTVPSHVPPEDRISRISSSQPPSHRNGSNENVPLKIGVH